MYVRQRLLDKPVRRAFHRVRQRSWDTLDGAGNGQPRPLHQAIQVGQRRRRFDRGVALAQHAEHLAQLGQRLAAGGPDQLRLGRQLRLCQVHLETSGVQHHQRNLVRHHVVHLAGDPSSFGDPGPLDLDLV